MQRGTERRRRIYVVGSEMSIFYLQVMKLAFAAALLIVSFRAVLLWRIVNHNVNGLEFAAAIKLSDAQS